MKNTKIVDMTFNINYHYYHFISAYTKYFNEVIFLSFFLIPHFPPFQPRTRRRPRCCLPSPARCVPTPNVAPTLKRPARALIRAAISAAAFVTSASVCPVYTDAGLRPKVGAGECDNLILVLHGIIDFTLSLALVAFCSAL